MPVACLQTVMYSMDCFSQQRNVNKSRAAESAQHRSNPGRFLRCRLCFAVAFSVLFAAVATKPADAQTPMRFVRIGVDDGLSQGTVNAIIQDPQGFMWFATQDGLDRYDGNSFTSISRERTNRGALPRNFVTTIASDGFGTLWIGTDGGGLASRDAATGVLTPRVEVRGAPVVADAERSKPSTSIVRDGCGWAQPITAW